MSRDSKLGHLERNIADLADDLCADLDQLLLEAGQRPVLDRLGCCERAQEVAEVVGESVKLMANCVGGKRAARQAGTDNLRRLDREAARGHSILMLMQWLPPMSPWPRS